MKLLVIGAGMMGTAAAFDMARNNNVVSVTLADSDKRRAKQAAERVNRLARRKVAQAVSIDAAEPRKAARLLGEHDAALSAVPYFFNTGLCKAAIDARCHFADLGGNNTVVKEEFALGRQAEKRGVAIAPDCGLSPGMASILAGELMRRIGGQAEALKIYVGGLPADPQPPFNYQLVFSVEGLINEYAEPAKILRKGKMATIEPLTEPEMFHSPGFPPLEAFHTSGGTSTLPETFAGHVGECFEKTLRYRGTLPAIRALYDFGFFSKDKIKLAKGEVAPRELTARLLCDRLSGNHADVTILRVEAHEKKSTGLRARLAGNGHAPRVLAFSMIDRYDAKSGMTSMMRTTAWPAAVVVQMLASGEIAKRGALRQEADIPANAFLEAMHARGIQINYEES
jgi:lysine 6-dehydrogenase